MTVFWFDRARSSPVLGVVESLYSSDVIPYSGSIGPDLHRYLVWLKADTLQMSYRTWGSKSTYFHHTGYRTSYQLDPFSQTVHPLPIELLQNPHISTILVTVLATTLIRVPKLSTRFLLNYSRIHIFQLRPYLLIISV